QRVGACRNSTNDLLISPSVSRSSDGSDYIEGGAGNDVIFGDGAQNEILGGNSNFFGQGGTCTAANETTASAAGTCARPDGSNIIFGGSGTVVDGGGVGDASTQGHDTNSDVIASDNAQIIRIVGTNGQYGKGATLAGGAGAVQVDATGFVRFNYDTYTDALPL